MIRPFHQVPMQYAFISHKNIKCCVDGFSKQEVNNRTRVNIRANPAITGLSLPGVPAPLSPIMQYADDTSPIVGSDRSIQAVFDTYSLFEKGSGSKLNLSKGLWLGSWCGRQDPPVSLDWTSSKIKVLRVFIGAGNLDEDNWKPRVDAVENVLSSWVRLTLSYEGSTLVINALALSRVW